MNPAQPPADADDIQRRIERETVGLSRTRTWGGIETRNHYGPADASPVYARDLGEPGEFPYTRGSYPQMYRSRMWTLRNIVGYGAPEDTRDGIEQAIAMGTAGIDITVDTLTAEAVDPDHPAVGADVGLEGCSLPTVDDLEILLSGIDVTKTDIAWHTSMMIYPMVVALAQRQGRDLRELQGSHMPDHLQLTISGWGEEIVPADLGHRTAVDCLEYSCRNSPKWALGMPQAYDLRERGMSPAAEIAVGMAIVNQTLSDLADRGVGVDEIAPSMAWVSTSDIDLFEEVAKFRALRRIWARTMKERHGAVSERSMRLRISCHTSGRSLVHPQPLNNLTRAAIQSLAALLGGVQSLEACTYDEPVGIPTPEARELATRTQQILAHEVGAARTADPLGGSWYIESLTDEVEARALAMLAEIEEIGIVRAVADGTIAGWSDDYNMSLEREMASGMRIQVGVNRFQPEEIVSPKRFTFDRGRIDAHLRRFAERKATRDHSALQQRITDLVQAVRRGENSHPPMIAALLAGGTIGEVWGSVRVANGYPYDPFKTIESPFDLSG